MSRNAGMNAGQIIGVINGEQVWGWTLPRACSTRHTVDMRTGEVVNLSIKCAKVFDYFANRQPSLVGTPTQLVVDGL